MQENKLAGKLPKISIPEGKDLRDTEPLTARTDIDGMVESLNTILEKDENEDHSDHICDDLLHQCMEHRRMKRSFSFRDGREGE